MFVCISFSYRCYMSISWRVYCSVRREKKQTNMGECKKYFELITYHMIYVYTNVSCVLCGVCCVVLYSTHRTLLCCKRHSRILHLLFSLHISVCHFKIYGFAHFFLFLSMYCSLRGNHICFLDIFLQFLPFSFVLIAVGAFVYRLSLHFFSRVFFGAA